VLDHIRSDQTDQDHCAWAHRVFSLRACPSNR
jgi:hypothetical protein